MVLLVTGCARAGSSSGTKGAGGGTAPAALPPGAVTYAVQQPFELNGLKWMVSSSEQLTEIKSPSGSASSAKPKNGAWLAATLYFRGSEGIPGGFDTAMLKLRGADGQVYDVVETGGAADDYGSTHKNLKNVSSIKLGNAKPQNVYAVFDVPSSGGPYSLDWMDAKSGAPVVVVTVPLGK